jgi:tetratricopeptide (TPR) repeat protein
MQPSPAARNGPQPTINHSLEGTARRKDVRALFQPIKSSPTTPMRQALRLVISGTVLTLTISLAAQGDNAGTTAAVGPDSATAKIEQAEAELSRGETDAAIETLNAVIAAAPASSLARTRLGGALMLKQNYTGAIEQFQQAISLNADNAPAFIGLGMAYLHLKQPGPAKAALTEAKKLDPAKQADIDRVLHRIENTAAAPHHP